MNITLFVTNNCSTCKRVKSQVEWLLGNRNDINITIKDLQKTRPEGIVIVPALFIDDELYSYGEIDEEKFLEYLQIYSSSN
jgi:glutaredoxin